MIKTCKGWLKKVERYEIYILAGLLLLNALVVAAGRRAGVSDFPDWSLWQASFVVSILSAWSLKHTSMGSSIYAVFLVIFFWILLPAVYLVMALWHWQLPAADFRWLMLTAMYSTASVWMLAFYDYMMRE